MTPKEKAKELVLKYASTTVTTYGCGAATGNPCLITNVMLSNSCKQCALIMVHEIIKLNINDRAFISEDKNNNRIVYSTYNEYWSEVLIEITKL